MSENPPAIRDGEKPKLLSMLLKKVADMKKASSESGGSTRSAENEAWRQIKQVSKENTLTKSGEED